MKKVVIVLSFLFFCFQAVYANETSVKINVSNGEENINIVAADIYADINGKLTEISIAPDKLPFKWNMKAGALRLKSFWVTEKQLKNNDTSNN